MNTEQPLGWTTIEQSKQLLEAGLDENTADMYYFLDPTPAGNIYHLTIIQVAFGVRSIPNYSEGDIPCWSLGKLIDLLPKLIKQKKFELNFNYGLQMYPTLTDEYCTAYANYTDDENLYSFTKEFPIKSAVNMVCFLLEKGYIKKGDVK